MKINRASILDKYKKEMNEILERVKTRQTDFFELSLNNKLLDIKSAVLEYTNDCEVQLLYKSYLNKILGSPRFVKRLFKAS